MKRWQACGVCAEPLARMRDSAGDGEWHWVHGDPSTEDHIPVPVDADAVQLATRCDFCYLPDPPWVLPATSFRMPNARERPGVNLTENSVGHWAACDECKELAVRRRWSALTTRVRRVDPNAAGIPRSHFMALYETFGAHVYGCLRREEWLALVDYPLVDERED